MFVTHANPISRASRGREFFLKCRSPKSGDRGVTKHTMKTNDTDMSEESQRDLAAGVLKQAAQDLRRFHGATTKIERELYLDAYSWAISDDCDWPFSFLNVCRLLNHRPDDLREELLSELSLGIFGQWARRGSRALRRLSDSVTERFTTGRGLSVAQPIQLVQTWH